MGDVIYMMDRKPVPLYNADSFGRLCNHFVRITVDKDVFQHIKTEGLLTEESHVLLNACGCSALCHLKGVTEHFVPAPKYEEVLQGNLGTFMGHRLFTDAHFPHDRRFLPDDEQP